MRWIPFFLCLWALTACTDSDSQDTATPDEPDSGDTGSGDTGSGDTGDTDSGDPGDTADEDTGDTGDAPTVQEAVEDLVGTYQGSWEMFGTDGDDQSYRAMTWTDEAIAENPTVEDDRAYVEVTDTMDMGPYGTYEQSWLEGYLLEADGSLGEMFMEFDGEVTVMTEVEEDHYQYETAVTSDDLYYCANVTPMNLVSGYHITDKVVTWPEGVETHDITRTTHLEYDAGGETVTLEFVSMVGQHEKVE